MLSKKSLIVLIALVFCICISHTSAKVVHLTGDSFDRSVNDGKAWFVEFFAPWCGHCKRLEPTWELISEQLEGEVVVASVDATVEKQLARRFNINGFPSLLFFKDGYYYTFHGADREPNTLTQFARAGYKQAEVTRLPQDNWFEPYLAQMERYVDDLLNIVQTRQLAGLTFLVFGFLSGILFALIFLFPKSRVVVRDAASTKAVKKEGKPKNE